MELVKGLLQPLGELLGFLENRVRNRDRSRHDGTIPPPDGAGSSHPLKRNRQKSHPSCDRIATFRNTEKGTGMTYRVSHPAVATLFLISILAIALLPSPAAAQKIPTRTGPLAQLAFSDPRLRLTSTADPLEQVTSLVPAEVREGWTRFTAGAGGSWQAYFDRRTSRLEVAEGSGIPWIPGDGNTLTVSSLPSGKADLAALEGIARAFLPRVAPMLGVDPASLALSQGRSGQQSAALWLVDF